MTRHLKSFLFFVCSAALIYTWLPAERSYAGNEAYSRIASTRSFDELLEYFSGSEIKLMRASLKRILTISDKRVPSFLMAVWENKSIGGVPENSALYMDLPSRVIAAEGLIDFGVGDVDSYEEFIFQMSDSQDPEIRSYAASALGSIGSVESVEKLSELVVVRHTTLALNSIGALKRIIIEKKPAKTNAVQVLRGLAFKSNSVHPFIKQQALSAYRSIFPKDEASRSLPTPNAVLSHNGRQKDIDRGIDVFYSGKNHKKALEILLPHAKSGDFKAQFYVGQILNVGINVRHDEREAAYWLLEAANQGHLGAQFEIANLYIAGKGVERNIPEAIKWLESSASQGYANSQELLAMAYQRGWWGLTKDPDKADKWLEKRESRQK